MSEEPLVSIITPAYNAERFIESTMKSVIEQSYKNWEHLIVLDQNSKDQTPHLVKKYSAVDSRVKLITSSLAFGAAANRNIALEQARGEYIAFIDADDLWAPDKLEKQLRFMQQNQHDFSFTGYCRISENAETRGMPQPVPARVSYHELLKNNSIACLTAMFRFAPFKSFRFQNKGWEDMAFWLQILSQIDYAYSLNEPLAFYRVVRGSRSNNKLFALRLRWDTYRSVQKISFINSLYYFASYALTSLIKYRRL